VPRSDEMAKRYWQHFEHGADVGIRGHGPTLEVAFEEAARALTAVIADPDAVAPSVAVTMTCTAPDYEILLVDWLNELVYEMDARKMVFGAFDVHIDGHRLTGTALGEHIDQVRHEPTVEVKGATFTAVKVGRENEGWVAQCVVDV
jgi:SHS2 domain-containing protein